MCDAAAQLPLTAAAMVAALPVAWAQVPCLGEPAARPAVLAAAAAVPCFPAAACRLRTASTAQAVDKSGFVKELLYTPQAG